MFKLKYDKILDNVIFTKNNLKPVVEDYFDINDLSFCVADGVTRDDIYGNPVIYPQTYEEAMKWIEKYPNPSGASKAAQIVCKTFINEISKYSHEKINKKIILKIAKQCNYALKSINDNRVIDYLKEDYYCCEAVGGIIVGDYLYCFSLGDCHITLLDSDFNVIFNTINNHSYFEKYLKDVYSKNNIFSWDMVIVLFTLLFMDMFDTIGTLVGVATKANMLDKNGKVPNIKKALFADAIGTTVGACLGTSTVSTFVESASGVAEGGRTGLTAVSTAFMFFLALFLSPIFGVFTSAVTASVLVIVGLFMIENIKELDLEDYTEAIPAFLTIIMMPFAYSISDGIVFGVVSYILLKLFTGRWKEVTWPTVMVGVIFVLKFIFI